MAIADRPSPSDRVTPKLDPVEGILAILDNGSATGTNKFGLLLALLDLAPSVDADGTLAVSRIAEKLIELHWDHARPFGSHADGTLRQVSSGNRANTTVLLVVSRLQEEVGHDLAFEQAYPMINALRWQIAVDEVARGTAKNPLRLLQNLPGGPPPFLYEILSGGSARIRFFDGAVDALVSYGSVLRDLVQFRFARFVTRINRMSLGTPIEDQIAEHLFGADRHMPSMAMRRDLWVIQGGCCLYTGLPVGDPSMRQDRVSLDHVVPWSRVRLSMAENFVVTTSSTNSAKSALLLGPLLLSRWLEYLVSNGDAIAAAAASHGWPSDMQRVVSVAEAQYRYARPATPVWCGVDGVDSLGVAQRDSAVELLKGFVVPSPREMEA
jgi:hypothetical protein